MHIARIVYSGNEVAFDYDTQGGRADVRDGYVLGVRVENTAQLTQVVVRNHQQTVLRRYPLTYDTDPVSQVVRIRTIAECGLGGSACLPATVFDWSGQASFALGDSVTRTLGDKAIVSPLPFDADGDGFSDMVFAQHASANTYRVMVAYNYQGTLGVPSYLFTLTIDDVATHPVKLIPSDIDGDGRAELVHYTQSGNGLRWQFYDFNERHVSAFEQCDATYACSITEVASHIVDMGLDVVTTGATKHELVLYDVNGDAYPDVIMPSSRYMNDGTGRFPDGPIQNNFAFLSKDNPNPLTGGGAVTLASSMSSAAEDDYTVMPLFEALDAYSQVWVNSGNREGPTVANSQGQCDTGQVLVDYTTLKNLRSG